MESVITRIAKTLSWDAKALARTIALLDEGNTVPFIARYRKEATQNMDDGTLRQLVELLAAMRAVDERRQSILKLLAEQGVEDQALLSAVRDANTLTILEDLYRPYKLKRLSRAQIAVEAGLMPLAVLLRKEDSSMAQAWALAEQLPSHEHFPDLTSKLNGAADILAEKLSDSPVVRSRVRAILKQSAVLKVKAKANRDSVYRTYYDFRRPLSKLKGHQVLAINRGEKEKFLTVSLEEENNIPLLLGGFFSTNHDKADFVQRILEDAWKRLLKPSLENELRRELTAEAEREAMLIFQENLRAILLERPLKNKTVLAFDPGYRNGCKLAATDPHGRVLATDVIFPLGSDRQKAMAEERVETLIHELGIEVLVIGNGTASAETEAFVEACQRKATKPLPVIIVNEAGASVYSASAQGAREFPEMDVALRSAVSLARRVQDPLAELVKIEPAALGVGQYQHDMDQKQLAEKLDQVVESCVNQVGCELNSASAALLSHIAGISKGLADNIVAYRDKEGRFLRRSDLLKVPRLGPKAYEQCAGFLRIADSTEPLDNSAVHPESYDVARKILLELGLKMTSSGLSSSENCRINIEALFTESCKTRLMEKLGIGRYTLDDIISELDKPGLDPRSLRELPVYTERPRSIEALQEGMQIEGTVRNVTAFGAFVDIGIHEDGLIHISELADHFVKDPATVVHTGQRLRVIVIHVDIEQKRIALSARPSRLQ